MTDNKLAKALRSIVNMLRDHPAMTREFVAVRDVNYYEDEDDWTIDLGIAVNNALQAYNIALADHDSTSAAPDAPAPVQPPANGDVDLEKVELWVANNCYDPVIEKTLFAAIAALQQKVGWQPIETAPKDGRTIILAHETSFLGFWDISQKAWCDHRKFYRDPSRWMALPPIPATGSQGESA